MSYMDLGIFFAVITFIIFLLVPFVGKLRRLFIKILEDSLVGEFLVVFENKEIENFNSAVFLALGYIAYTVLVVLLY